MARRLALFFVLLMPSAVFSWTYLQMPRFGYLNDDAILFTSAKNLATTGEYRIESLPGEAYQTKYPPLFPLYLSLVWRINPHFPENLRLATVFCWILLVPYVVLAWILYRRSGLSERFAFALVAVLALSPYVILFGTATMTEVAFTCLLLVTLLVAERNTAKSALIAGALAGVAYLSRTAGIALLVSMPLYYWLQRSRRNAALFCGGMLPFIVAWMLWSRGHRSEDVDLLVYTDYIGYQFRNVGWDNFVLVWTTNLRELAYAIGKLALPQVSGGYWLRIVTPPLALVMCMGVARLARARVLLSYALFAVVSCAILIVWHFPPNERFVLPLFPIFLVGLVRELQRMVTVVHAARSHEARHEGSRDVAVTPIAARVLTAAVAMVATGLVCAQFYGTMKFLPAQMRAEQERQRDHVAVYAWMKRNLPQSATILSTEDQDPVVYLYTGLHGNTSSPPPRDWYSHNANAVLAFYRDIAEYCRRRNLGYVYFARDDFELHGGGIADGDEIVEIIHQNPKLMPVFQAGQSIVYQVRDVSR